MLGDGNTLFRATARRTEPIAVPVRVFLLIGQLGLGGTEKQVALLADGLRRRDIDVEVLVLFEGGAWEGPLRAMGVPVVHLGFRRRAAGWWMLPANVAAFCRLVRYLCRTRPDVLHAFLYHSYVTAAPAARLAGVPVLVAGRRSLGDFKQQRRTLLVAERAANSMTDLLVANAHSVADDTRRNEAVPHGKVSVVYNGLPDSAFTPAVPAEIDTDLPVVLCVANLKPYKGHQYLLDAVARLWPAMPSTLVLVGEGPERPALKRQAERLGIDVRFLGARTDVDRLLARAEVVVLPSLHEGMSNAVMEAMAAGRAVVASDVGGTGELLRGRGVLVPPADSAALAGALERVLTDHALAKRLGESARAWSRANLSVDSMVDRHVRIYGELLERRCAE